MEAAAIWVNIGGNTVILETVYLSPLRSLVETDLWVYISGGKPVLLAGDVKAKLKDCNSWLNSPRGVLLREFAAANSYFVLGADSPTTIPSSSTVIPDVLDIVVVKDFVQPVNLTVCSALSSDHLPVTVDHPSIILPRPSKPAMLETSELKSLLGSLNWQIEFKFLSEFRGGYRRYAWWVDQCYSRSHVCIRTTEATSQAAATLHSATILTNVREENELRRKGQVYSDQNTKYRRIKSITSKGRLISSSRTGGSLNRLIHSSL